ncbi:MAG: glycyl-radical enzyme activator family protein [Dehalococcoidia bacterium]|nr:glycyl-radical enzyme activator family protein [Dehalococcoidia bacterium]
MKGCPLQCLWCGNPETQQFKPQLLYSSNRCSIIMAGNGKPKTDRKLCRDCGICTQVCPSGARTMVGMYMSVEELLCEVKKDAPFYRSSDGGVTVGGGEPAMQSQTVSELLRRCQLELNINTAIETCGFADYQALETTVRFADLIFYDIKHMEPSRHRVLTGVSNQVILENIRRLAFEGNKKIVIRTPVIPGYNDSEDSIRNLGEFVASLGKAIARVELLPYHNYGAIKYIQLGRRYRLGKVKIPAPEHLSRLKDIIVATGIAAQIG